VPKRAGRVAGGLDDMVISLYAHGMSVRDILHHLEQVYGTQLSHETVSRITGGVLEEVRAWQSRPLDPVYAVVFPAAIRAGSATTTWCRTSPPIPRSAPALTARSTCRRAPGVVARSVPRDLRGHTAGDVARQVSDDDRDGGNVLGRLARHGQPGVVLAGPGRQVRPGSFWAALPAESRHGSPGDAGHDRR